ncbi:MAG TPA: alpha/beta hydrolase [Isosphaeraceae bacterium]|jgi:dienelactone hydrolase|nr:alpha/beta hydrolase [Isosphaeraceae bacterium]
MNRRARLRIACALPMAVGLATLTTGAAPQERAPVPSPAFVPAVSYPYQAVKRHEYGVGAKSYWIFEPAEPTPKTAPVVVFHHGWLAVNPGAYGAWIEHLVRSGRIVILPRYQDDWTTRPAEFLPNALEAVRDAFDVLQTARDHVRPDRERFALIGHSAGGNLSAQMAAVARETGLPPPKALVLLMPGEVKSLREPNLSRIPSTTLLVVVAAEHDRVVGDLRARQIYLGATSVPSARKKYVFYRTDRHGFPHLIADHLAPTAALELFDTGEGPFHSLQMTEAEINAFDYRGFWRLADITIDAGFAGRTLDEATHYGDLFRDLGHWSDGTAVISPLVTDDISTIPRVFPSNGLKLIPWQVSGFPLIED